MGDAAQFFDAIAARYDRVYARTADESRASLARVLGELAPSSHVLDLGVGTGRELPFLLDAGHQPVGFDVSSQMLALCAKRARPIPLIQGDLWAPLPFASGSFDAILALHGTLAHAPDAEARRAFPFEAARVVRAGGIFVAEVPTASWFESNVGAANKAGRSAWFGDGHGRFADDKTGLSIDVWLASVDEWTEMFEPTFALTVRPGGLGEIVLVGRRR